MPTAQLTIEPYKGNRVALYINGQLALIGKPARIAHIAHALRNTQAHKA